MVGQRDYQQQRVYDWEATLPKGKKIAYDNIQEYINRVWEDMGLKYPPKVMPMPKQMQKALADANRYHIRFRDYGATEQTILHEMAHSMTMNLDGKGHQHNDVFVGVYMTLLEKYLGLAPFMLWYSAEKCKVDYVKFAKPRIVDTAELNKD